MEILETSRSKQLKQLTHATHDRLDKSITSVDTFQTLNGYGRFVQMQYQFHRDIDALYDDAVLQSVLPGLISRRRLALVAADLADLGLMQPDANIAPAFAAGSIDVPTALGWLYVAEGSNMGAALLRKEAAKLGLSDSHGAQHLAPTEDGPAAHWRAFTAALDAATLSEDEEARVVAGANDAFARVQSYADAAFA